MSLCFLSTFNFSRSRKVRPERALEQGPGPVQISGLHRGVKWKPLGPEVPGIRRHHWPAGCQLVYIKKSLWLDLRFVKHDFVLLAQTDPSLIRLKVRMQCTGINMETANNKRIYFDNLHSSKTSELLIQCAEYLIFIEQQWKGVFIFWNQGIAPWPPSPGELPAFNMWEWESEQILEPQWSEGLLCKGMTVMPSPALHQIELDRESIRSSPRVLN